MEYRVQPIMPVSPVYDARRQPDSKGMLDSRRIRIQWRKEPVREVEVRREADKNGGIDILA